jgi:DNA-binding protein HU-beta
MNKTQFVEAVAKKAKINKKAAETAVRATLDVISDVLRKNDRVVLPGFGTFGCSNRKARTGRNPSTGETIKIPARRVARFKAGTKLRDSIAKTKR